MASEPLEVGDYVRWDKSAADEFPTKFGDHLMIIMKIERDYVYVRNANTDAPVGSANGGGFYPERFTKQSRFIGLAHQAIKGHKHGKTKTRSRRLRSVG